MRADLATAGYSGCTFRTRSPSIILEMRGVRAVRDGGGGRALAFALATEFRTEFRLQRSPGPLGTPISPTCGGGACSTIVAMPVCISLGTITIQFARLLWGLFVARTCAKSRDGPGGGLGAISGPSSCTW